MRFRSRFSLLIPAMAALLVSACFTEVGNAEDEKLVSGEFKIDYAPDAKPLPKSRTSIAQPESISITHFSMSMREAEFKAYDSVAMKFVEIHLWKEDSLTLPVDFTGMDTASSLPVRKLGIYHPDNLTLQCVVPKHAALLADTIDFESFKDNGFIKGYFGSGKNARAFLFQLPESREIHLEYSKAALDGWYRGNVYRCEFVFFATKWIQGAGLASAEDSRDKSGKPLILLGIGHNAGVYQALVDRFYKSFNTSRVFAEVGR